MRGSIHKTCWFTFAWALQNTEDVPWVDRPVGKNDVARPNVFSPKDRIDVIYVWRQRLPKNIAALLKEPIKTDQGREWLILRRTGLEIPKLDASLPSPGARGRGGTGNTDIFHLVYHSGVGNPRAVGPAELIEIIVECDIRCHHFRLCASLQQHTTHLINVHGSVLVIVLVVLYNITYAIGQRAHEGGFV